MDDENQMARADQEFQLLLKQVADAWGQQRAPVETAADFAKRHGLQEMPVAIRSRSTDPHTGETAELVDHALRQGFDPDLIESVEIIDDNWVRVVVHGPNGKRIVIRSPRHPLFAEA